jgi:uncharacterized protein YggU (UPF0235/DUF167 family)
MEPREFGRPSIPPTALRAVERGLRPETQTPQEHVALVSGLNSRSRHVSVSLC